jgi:GH15 family glucan-1,4-alpha-glucosidase
MAAEVSKIQDYAIIGNGRSAALISKHGSLDWLCWPRFDSASIFGAIIDPRIGGRWSIHPADDSQISRRYVDNTNVLETTFSNSSGKIVLTDFMAVTSEKEKTRRLWPEHELIRLIKCEAGEVRIVVEFYPRPDYGRTTPLIKDAGKLGWRLNVGKNGKIAPLHSQSVYCRVSPFPRLSSDLKRKINKRRDSNTYRR